MTTATKESIKAMARYAALIAIDQQDEFGTVNTTIQAYRENLMDTLKEQGLTDWEDIAIDTYDRYISDKQA